MKPSARRRVEREIRAMMERDGDHCSVCRAPLPHNSRTFGGVLRGGEPALAGECCRAGLTVTILQGIYLARDFEDLPDGWRGGSSGTLPQAKVEDAIRAVQSLANARSKIRTDVSNRGGVDPDRTIIYMEASPWKSDDANWFEANPDRTHRLRPSFDGEFPPETFGNIRPGNRTSVIVRQVEPGRRIRLPFTHGLLHHVSDDDAVLHSEFDRMAASGGTSGAADRSQGYRDAVTGKLN